MPTLAQTNTGDLALARGALRIVRDSVEHAAIKIRNRLLFFKGEWFLDTRLGVPYFEMVLVKNPDMGAIKRLFTEVILSVSPIVQSVEYTELELDAERRLAVTFKAVCEDGSTIEGGTLEPFIVNGSPLSEGGF